MVDVGIADLGYVGYAKETVEGTAVAPSIFLPARSVSFSDANDYIIPAQIRGNRDDAVAMPAPFPVTGSMELDLISDGIGYLLKSAFAASVATSAYAGGGYSHVFTPGNVSPTFTFETSAADILIMRYMGVRVNTMELKAAFGEIVSASFGLDGIDRVKQATPTADTFPDSSLTPFHFNTTQVKVAGATNANVKDFSINLNNNVSHIGTLRASRAYKRVAMGARKMSGKMTFDLQDTAEYDRLLNDNELALQLYMEGPDLTVNAGKKTSLKIDLPRVKYRVASVPINSGDFLSVEVDVTVLRPNTGGEIATVTLVSNETGYP
jgi:hypothetical protein